MLVDVNGAAKKRSGIAYATRLLDSFRHFVAALRDSGLFSNSGMPMPLAWNIDPPSWNAVCPSPGGCADSVDQRYNIYKPAIPGDAEVGSACIVEYARGAPLKVGGYHSRAAGEHWSPHCVGRALLRREISYRQGRVCQAGKSQAALRMRKQKRCKTRSISSRQLGPRIIADQRPCRREPKCARSQPVGSTKTCGLPDGDSRCRVPSCGRRYADAPTVSRSPPAAGGRISSVLRATTVHCCGRTQDCGLYAVLPLSGVQFAGLNHHWYADEPLGVWTEINCALH